MMGVAGIETGDMNNDGRAEVVLHWEIGAKSATQILRNDGNFNFTDVTTDWLGSYLVRDAHKHEGVDAQQLYALANLRDINRDGVLDLSLSSFNSDPSQVADGTVGGAFAYINDGTGHLTAMNMFVGDTEVTASQLTSMTTNNEWSVGLPVLIDANNDGITDTTFIDYTTDTISNAGVISTMALNITTVFGAESGHVYAANADGETLQGTNGVDRFVNGRGNDVFNGGEGRDTLVVNGARRDYAVASIDSDSFYVRSATEVNVIHNIERVQFNDLSLALDINGTGGQAYRLYKAAFDRAPDLPGLGFWIKALDNGTSLQDVAFAFTHSEEFNSLYGSNVSTGRFVNALYNNVLDRNPEKAGFDWWSDVLDSGRASRENVLVGFSESGENQANLVGVMQNGFEYVPFVA